MLQLYLECDLARFYDKNTIVLAQEITLGIWGETMQKYKPGTNVSLIWEMIVSGAQWLAVIYH